MNINDINIKYLKGTDRILLETGNYNLPLLKTLFGQQNYSLKSEFPAREDWDTVKRSLLIESFIINLPVPPIFLYEEDFHDYKIIDGLQRVLTIIDFYNDKFELKGLELWKELEGMKYSQLPSNLRERLDKKRLQMIVWLKEPGEISINYEKIKQLAFERLNNF